MPTPLVCLDCHKPLPVYPAGHCGGTGYASLPSGGRICYPCADMRQRQELKTATRYGVYLSGDGKALTTWTGGELARVTSETESRTGWYGSRITHIRAVAPDGSRWYGKGAGRGMCLTIHRSVAKRAA